VSGVTGVGPGRTDGSCMARPLRSLPWLSAVLLLALGAGRPAAAEAPLGCPADFERQVVVLLRRTLRARRAG